MKLIPIFSHYFPLSLPLISLLLYLPSSLTFTLNPNNTLSQIKSQNPSFSFTLLSFAGGRKRYYDFLKLIMHEAKSMDIFTNYIPITAEDLKEDTFFWSHFGKIISSNSRGFGFWCWKPYIIYKQLQKMNDNDYLLYCDSGKCVFNKKGRYRMINEYLNDLNDYDIVISQTCKSCKNKFFTKKYAINFFNLTEEELEMPQFEAGLIYIKKNNKTLELYKKIVDLEVGNFKLFNGNTEHENSFLKEHRHDQTVLTCMLLKSDLKYKVFKSSFHRSAYKDTDEPIIINKRPSAKSIKSDL